MEQSVSLEEITEDTLKSVLMLEVAENQKNLVASNAVSIAQAHFSPTAWFRAIYADKNPVGFVMLSLDPQKPEYFLWRFMIAEKFQGKGYGTGAMEQVIDFVKSLPNSRELLASYVPEPGNPSGFYKKLGFEETGLEEDGEKVMSLSLE